jgi:predicted metal-binding membrane protein
VRRDRAIIAAALVGVAAIAWGYLLHLGSGMSGAAASDAMPAMPDMPDMAMPQTSAWTTLEALLLFAMWAVMMVAMMLPAAAPMILLFATVTRRRRERASPAAPTTVFAGGYLLVWTAFSAVAALTQLGLHRAALLSPAMAATSSMVGGVLLLAAGAYQWTPIKYACLSRCRSPIGFLGSEWREGRWGALVMGLRHGLFCLGCCWALMALLFVAGVMNLVWVAAIAALALVEKLAPVGAVVGRAAGVIFAAWGIYLIAAAL